MADEGGRGEPRSSRAGPVPAGATQPGARGAPFGSLLLASGALLFLSQSALLGAGFSGDDWAFVAMVRHMDTPWPAYWQDHTSTYAYRPHAMLLWWLSVWAWGDAEPAHYALNLLLHWGCALLLGLYAYALLGQRAAALLAACLYTVHPTAAASAWWLTDRFDLLALAGILGALLGAERALRGEGSRLWVLLASFIGAGGKEYAVLILPLLALRLWLAPERPWRWRIETLALAAAPLLLMIWARAQVVAGVETTLQLEARLQPLLTGLWAWWWQWPGAMLGLRQGVPPVVALAAALAFAAGLGWALRARHTALGRAALLALGLLLLPAATLWPVAQLVLVHTDALSLVPNARFYAVAIAGLALGVAVLLAGLRAAPRLRPWGYGIAGVAVALAGAVSHARGQQWAESTQQAASRQLARAAQVALSDDTPRARPCIVRLLGAPAELEEFHGYADFMVKAGLPTGHPMAGCVVLTERAGWIQQTEAGLCRVGDFAPLEPRMNGPHPLLPRRLGPLCLHYFERTIPAELPGQQRYRLRAGHFLPEE